MIWSTFCWSLNTLATHNGGKKSDFKPYLTRYHELSILDNSA